MSECIFCKIIKGEIPSCRIYEDDLVYAFLDIGPINFGHTLVIPKEHHESSATIPEATAGRMFRIGSRIGVALKRELDYEAFNLHLADGTAAGQVVMHAHLHVIPRGVEDGFHWNWRQLRYGDGEAAAVAEKIVKRLAATVAGK
ncbi:HIT family protein [uncultured Victivallis sp.]|uniref:HIT family protein n=1 Tax=uncultured Victivallis sp. TaxID=354118 RepID=UPI0025F22EC9|nr:HIT family protein [uncultured Victivallis sp.]